MKHILIVDDDLIHLDLLKKIFAPYARYIKVHTARNGDQANRTFSKRKVDLIITDLRMPGFDGFELLAYIHNYFPDILAFVMTGLKIPDLWKKIRGFNPRGFFEKPINERMLMKSVLEELQYIYTENPQKIEKQDNKSKDKIWGIHITAFVQLLNMEKKTCVLAVESSDKKGLLFFSKGELLTAAKKPPANLLIQYFKTVHFPPGITDLQVLKF
jgi:YesN/AraC family two-component response regulator